MDINESKYFRDFENRKKTLRILILGAYFPNACQERLSNFRDFLIKNNYSNAKLIKDFPDKPSFHNDESIHNLEKSKYYIKNWSEVILFVFSNNGSNEGVSIEFEFCCSKAIEKLSFSVVFEESGLRLSSLILGSVSLNEIKSDSFENTEDLCGKALGYLTNFVYRLFWY
jgi:hypothetical protein